MEDHQNILYPGVSLEIASRMMGLGIPRLRWLLRTGRLGGHQVAGVWRVHWRSARWPIPPRMLGRPPRGARARP